MSGWFQSIVLNGENVELIPLKESHANELVDAAADGNLWELWFTSVPSRRTVEKYIAEALDEKQNGSSYPFVVVDKISQKIIGSTRYCNATPEHRRLEIGYTWYAQTFQRTGVNTECKYLLLCHAFEMLNCIAVEFRTSWHNIRSRVAILRLGAKQDGILRNHRLNADGSYRDSVVFSITDQEWHEVKTSLEQKMEQFKDHS